MSFTLTDTQVVPALQLLQQPVFHQHRKLGFFIKYLALNKCVKPNTVQLLYSCGGRKWRSGTNPLIIILANSELELFDSRRGQVTTGRNWQK